MNVMNFLMIFVTISELQSLAQRLEVAQMLKMKKTYDKIQGETGASTATISRVRRCVDYGSGGYGKVLGRLYPQVDEEQVETNKYPDASLMLSAN